MTAKELERIIARKGQSFTMFMQAYHVADEVRDDPALLARLEEAVNKRLRAYSKGEAAQRLRTRLFDDGHFDIKQTRVTSVSTPSKRDVAAMLMYVNSLTSTAYGQRKARDHRASAFADRLIDALENISIAPDLKKEIAKALENMSTQDITNLADTYEVALDAQDFDSRQTFLFIAERLRDRSQKLKQQTWKHIARTITAKGNIAKEKKAIMRAQMMGLNFAYIAAADANRWITDPRGMQNEQ